MAKTGKMAVTVAMVPRVCTRNRDTPRWDRSIVSGEQAMAVTAAMVVMAAMVGAAGLAVPVASSSLTTWNSQWPRARTPMRARGGASMPTATARRMVAMVATAERAETAGKEARAVTPAIPTRRGATKNPDELEATEIGGGWAILEV